MLLPLRAASRAAGLFALVASAIALPCAAAPQAETAPAAPVWLADFDEAAKVAKAQNKDLLVDFTGSDWCVWCVRLDQEVFSRPEFLDAAKKDFVLVKLDFPKGEEAQKLVPNPERNEELREKYEVGGFPTILLVDSSGEVFGSTGYKAGGAAKYVEHLGEVQRSGKKLLAALEAWNKSEGEARPQAWDALASAYEPLDPSSTLVNKASPAIREALTFDADNAQGRKLRAFKALYRHFRAEPGDEAPARALDPKNEHGLLELVVQMAMFQVQDEEAARKALEQVDALGAVKDKEVGFRLNAVAASYAQTMGDLPRAKAYAQKAKDIGGDDAQLNQVIEAVLKS